MFIIARKIEDRMKLFDQIPGDTARIQPFDNERSSGLDISWAMHGVGFGHITIARNKSTGEWSVDDEEMGPTSVARIIMALVGTTVQSPGDNPVMVFRAGPGGAEFITDLKPLEGGDG